MIHLISLAATLALLLPALLFVALRASPAREPWRIALDIPLAVSIDLMVVLALTRIMRLEAAAVVSRAIYVLLGAVVVVRRRSARRWPVAIRLPFLVRIGVSVLVGLGISLWLSRTYAIWDRGWHIPLTGSMRGQSLPFTNAYSPAEVLHYHFSGNVQAAVLQVLSGGVVHVSLALSLVHDLHFALIGLVLALFMVGWGYRRVAAFVLAPAALLLSGPVHLFREQIRTPQEGYSFVSFLSFSFRPHTALGALLLLGFVGAVVARLGERDDLPLAATGPALIGSAAGLAVTEETSLGILGLGLGLVWLFAPRVIHPRRLVGVVVILALAVALVVPNLAFSASLSPGGEPHVIKLVPWRSPGYYRAALPLATAQGRLMLGYDLCAPITALIGVVVLALLRRGRGRGVLAAFFFVVFAISTILLTRLDVDGQGQEAHRFGLGLFVIGPFMALALVARRFPASGTPAKSTPYAIAVMACGLSAAAASTVDWVLYTAPQWATGPAALGAYDLYKINCLAAVGDHRWARPRWTYVSRPIYYLVTGCMPTYTPGSPHQSGWKQLTVGLPKEGGEALAAVRKALPPGAPVPLVCPREPAGADAACALARARGSCKPAGLVVEECTLTASEAATIPPK